MVVAKNDMDFDPKYDNDQETDSCSNVWRISQVSCWFHWQYFSITPGYVDSNGAYHPPSQIINTDVYNHCNNTCCARLLRVCRLGPLTVSLTDLGVYSNADSCEGLNHPNPWAFTFPGDPNPPPDSLPCYFTCDFLEDIDEVYEGKTPDYLLPDNKDLLDYKPKQGDIFGKLNVSYSSTLFNVIVDETNASEITISIYNIVGDLLINKPYALMPGYNKFEIDISNLISGIYVYNIVINGIIIKTGKVNLIR